jgi:hypothetical protein
MLRNTILGRGPLENGCIFLHEPDIALNTH